VITRFPPLEFKPGDEIEMRMPGGAGFGAPAAREPALILHDLTMGYITPHGAQTDYGVDDNALKPTDPSN
jgi:N-methylhydantoinase B